MLFAAARCCSRLSWAGRKRVLQCAGIFPVTGNRQQIKKPEAHLSDSTSAFLYNRWSSCFCASHVRAAVLWLVLASNSLCYDLQRPESCCCVNTFYFFVLLIVFFFFFFKVGFYGVKLLVHICMVWKVASWNGLLDYSIMYLAQG